MVMEIVISLIILFVGIAILVSIHFCIVGRAFRSDNNSGDIIQDQSGTRRTSTKGTFGDNIGDLNNLPCFDYVEPEKGGNLVDCAVCLESFKVGDACRLLSNCRHSFHVQCIDLWILKTPFCPICRTWVHSRVTVREESAVSDSDIVEIEMP
uniref:RING-type E3 ubiquitin transferase n=1 Tax=Cicer arietinum TaxID=3827 RepID=A0A1S3E7E3_CICAR|nr:RING-H2 finger protein ATL2-like [Cicer arietinum]